MRPSRACIFPTAVLRMAVWLTACGTALGQPAALKPAPDVIVFTNGDQLSGTLERGVGNSITFKSDMAGEITVPLDKIKQLRSSGSFAVLRKDIQPTRKNVIPGTLLYQDGTMSVLAPLGEPETVPEAQVSYIIDQPTYDMELEKKPGTLYGWHGAVSGGTTIVRSTSNGSTYTVGVNLSRAIPAVPYLPARNRTAFDLQETYGKLTSTFIPQTNPPRPPSVALTSIFHTDLERDEYFTPRFYALVQTSFDHNYAQGLNLQQIYGGGIGWTAIKDARRELDIKTTAQYEKQEFETPANNLNLVGSTISESYHRTLPRKLVFSETANFLPAWNDFHAYSSNATAALVMPVFRRLSLTITTTDNFLNNPAAGFKKNSFQFVTAASYTLR
jgi:hypothetical protein